MIVLDLVLDLRPNFWTISLASFYNLLRRNLFDDASNISPEITKIEVTPSEIGPKSDPVFASFAEGVVVAAGKTGVPAGALEGDGDADCDDGDVDACP